MWLTLAKIKSAYSTRSRGHRFIRVLLTRRVPCLGHLYPSVLYARDELQWHTIVQYQDI